MKYKIGDIIEIHNPIKPLYRYKGDIVRIKSVEVQGVYDENLIFWTYNEIRLGKYTKTKLWRVLNDK